MKKLATLAGALLGVACLFLFLRSAAKHWSAFQNLSLDAMGFACLAGAIVCYLGTHGASAAGWRLALRVFNEPLRYADALRIVTLSQIGKYLPGNVGQHVGRILLVQRSGIATGHAVMSLALESILLLGAAAFCCLAAYDLLLQAASSHTQAIERNLSIVAGVGLLALLLALAIRWSRQKLVHFAHRWLVLFSLRNFGLYARILLLQAISFGVGAVALWLAIQAVSPIPLAAPASIVGVYSIAWLLGFIVPGAPAGLGIREALLVAGLSTLYGAEPAVLGTALFRLVTLLGDGIAFLCGLTLSRLHRTKNHIGA
jgi:hypothetical protein